MQKKVNKIVLRLDVVKVELEGTAEERKTEVARLSKIATDMKAQEISLREENNRTFLTYVIGSNTDALVVMLSN